MKESIIKTVTLIIGFGLLAYTGWLFFQGYHVVGSDLKTMNMIALFVCACIGLFLVSVVFIPGVVPTNRWSLMIMGLGLILVSHYYLVDNSSLGIYLGDIMKLVGVFLAITGPMKVMVSEKVQAELAAKEVEIIEV